MTILQLVFTRDQAAQVSNPPIAVVSLGVAIRSFGDEANRADPNNQVWKHPDDFTLWHGGEYDDSTGTVTWFPHAKQLALARDLVMASYDQAQHPPRQ